jgi:Family of unknown function (DUF5317)/Major Facilitator Superfamily/Transketolase, C-terminal domain
MFLLPAIALGFVLAAVLGGKPSRLLKVEFRHTWTVWLALGVQVALFSRLGADLPDPLRAPLHLGTYGLLVVFAVLNVHIRALLLVPLGMLLNAIAIAANGGRMPVSEGAAAAVDLSEGDFANVSASADRLGFLGDVFALPSQLPLANVFSVGDVLIAFGMVAFIVIVSTDDGAERALSFSRLVLPLRTTAYRRLAVGKLVSHVGDWLTLAALVGWIYEKTGSTGQVAVLLLVRLAPPILGGGVAAMLIDRLPKKSVLVVIELARGVAVLTALAGVLTGSLPLVYAALAVSGGLAAISNAAVPAVLPSLLPVEQLASANAGLGLAKDGAMALGSVGAGVALSWLGIVPALAADLVTFAVACTAFALLPATVKRADSDDEEEARIPGGLRYVVSRRPLLLLVVSFASATLATGLTNATLPRFLEHEVGLGAGGYGFGIAALACGLALGQAMVGFARVGENAGRWIGAGLVVMAGLFVLLGLSEHAPTILFIVAMIGFVDGTTDVLFETTVQRESDPRRYGAVFGLASAFITTTMVGAVAIAPLINRLLDPHRVILLASVFLVVAGTIALVGMRPARPRVERAPVLAVAAAGGATVSIPLAAFRREPTPAPTTRVARRGEDLTLVTWEHLLPRAESLDAGASVELVLVPEHDGWDSELVLASLRRTSRLAVLHDAARKAAAAEILAVVAELGYEDLDAPLRRIEDGPDAQRRLVDLAEF